MGERLVQKSGTFLSRTYSEASDTTADRVYVVSSFLSCRRAYRIHIRYCPYYLRGIRAASQQKIYWISTPCQALRLYRL